MTTDPPQRAWSVHDYEAGDERAIVALFEGTFGKPMGQTESAAHWRWEYEQNPTPGRLIKLAWDGDTLAGHYAVSPRRLRCDGRDVLAALSLDTMTHRDYGRQGIFTTTAEACYASMATDGFAFVYGFPNANSVGGFQRGLQWTFMPPPVLVKPLDAGPFLKDRVGPLLGRWLSGASRLASHAPGLLARATARVDGSAAIRVHASTDFDDWADDLWRRCRDQHRVWVVRDRAFLHWRYAARPESDYVIVRAEHEGDVCGYAVAAFADRSGGKGCFVMDLLARTDVPGTASALLRALEHHARERECAFSSGLVGPGSGYRREFLRHAFVPIPTRLYPQELYLGMRTMHGQPPGPHLEPTAWQFGWGDVDVL